LADHPPSAPLGENEVIDEEPNGVIDFSQVNFIKKSLVVLQKSIFKTL
jgi:hypothetical protein